MQGLLRPRAVGDAALGRVRSGCTNRAQSREHMRGASPAAVTDGRFTLSAIAAEVTVRFGGFIDGELNASTATTATAAGTRTSAARRGVTLRW